METLPRREAGPAIIPASKVITREPLNPHMRVPSHTESVTLRICIRNSRSEAKRLGKKAGGQRRGRRKTRRVAGPDNGPDSVVMAVRSDRGGAVVVTDMRR